MLRVRPGRRRPHHRPTRRLRRVAARAARLLGCADDLAHGTRPAHARDRRRAPSRPTRRRRSTSWPTSAPTPATGNLWTFRRIVARHNFRPGTYPSDVVPRELADDRLHRRPDRRRARDGARGARGIAPGSSRLSMLYWLQTEAPRADGGTGLPGLRLRSDLTGTGPTGSRMAPYIRESRRILAETTVTELDLSIAVRGDASAGRLPRQRRRRDVPHRPAPLHGRRQLHRPALATLRDPPRSPDPPRLENLLPAGKNSVPPTSPTAAFRLHPVEWNIGEAAGRLAAFCLDRAVTAPRAIRTNPELLRGVPDPAHERRRRAALAGRRLGILSENIMRSARALTGVGFAAAATLALAGCSGGGAPGSTPPGHRAADDGVDLERGRTSRCSTRSPTRTWRTTPR